MTTKKTKKISTAQTDTTTDATTTDSNASSSIVFVKPPPPGAKIPTPPSGANASSGSKYAAVVPTASEQDALSGAIDDLGRFTDFAQVFGLSGYTLAQVLQGFGVGAQWTVMRNESVAWDAYALTQEGLSWVNIRSMMKQLKPLFQIASANNSALAQTYPGLTALFNAKRAVAAKANSTKRANKAATAAGKPATHGAVGKARQTKAAKALLATSQGKSEPGASPPPLSTPVAQAPANTGPAGTVSH